MGPHRGTACIVSHRFGGFDGVSVEAEKWCAALESLGYRVLRAAGRFEDRGRNGDTEVDGLWAPVFGGTPPPVDEALIDHLCRTSDVLILDNLGSLWTTPLAASAFEASALRHDLPTIVRHHDPPWQTPHVPTRMELLLPLHHPAMLHVTINELTRTQFAHRWPQLVDTGSLTVEYNRVDVCALQGGDRERIRRQRGVEAGDVLVLHPARNIARKNVDVALAVTASLNGSVNRAHHWLTDPAGAIPGDGAFGSPGVLRGWESDTASMYAAADLVVLPSSWEGWRLPVVEAAASGTLIAAGPYPVLREIESFGLEVLDPRDVTGISQVLKDEMVSAEMIDRNRTAARALSTDRLPGRLTGLIERAQALV